MKISLSELLFLSVFFWNTLLQGQAPPRLIIGITVDQMRYDYLYRFWEDYGESGFKRFLREGYAAHDAHYHYAPTYTGPGHASIYTGTGPAQHGIVGNEWYSRTEKKQVYCAEDASANTIGSASREGKMSPRRLTSTTLADQLELATNRRSKTIGLSIKDRGAVLPMGNLSDGAYWYDKTNGFFITSDFYRKELPAWLHEFNEKKLPEKYLNESWSPLLPAQRYEESLPDDKPYERPFLNTEKAVFPYDLKTISETRRFGAGESPFEIILHTPHGNSLLFDLAKSAIRGEQMGTDEVPDLLAISFSSTDYAGHRFGPHSVEIHDMYLRFDRELGAFISFVDSLIGLSHTLIFLTADHAAADIPGIAGHPAGYFKSKNFEDGLRQFLKAKTGEDPIEYFINEQVYLKTNLRTNPFALEKYLQEYADRQPGVFQIIPLQRMENCQAEPSICEKIRKGVMSGRSGDYYIQLLPGWLPDYTEKGGTTHGSPYAYDTHVPLIFFGWKLKPGNHFRRVWVEDIAPSVCQILKITYPSGCTGSLISEMFNHIRP